MGVMESTVNREQRGADENALAGQSNGRHRLLLTTLSVLCFSLVTVGCATFGPVRTPSPTNVQLNDQRPDPKQVVTNYLNTNASRINSIEAHDLDIELKAGSQQFGVNGDLHCQKPRNFRLRAKTVGKQVADIGSNDQEFWTWNSEDRPQVLYFCSYDALTRGNIPLPFPIQPEWVLEVLGMVTLNPNGNFSVPSFGDPKEPGKKPRTFDLLERTTGPGGQPITKVTVLNNFNASDKTPQVVAHRLYDSRNRLICQATILSVHREQVVPGDPHSWVAVPNHVKLEFPAAQPAQSMSMTLKLDGFRLNGAEADIARNPRLYQRPTLHDVPSHDLARGLPAIPTGVQRTSGWGR